MKKFIACFLCLTMGITVLAGCSGNAPVTDASGSGFAPITPETSASTPVSSKPDTFIYATANEPPSIDPAKGAGTPVGPIYSALYEGLVTTDMETGSVIPGVAESWSVSEDGLTYTFKIRETAKWSDGQPLTADDFVYSWLRVLDPKTASGYSWYSHLFLKNALEYSDGTVAATEVGVKALDDYTLEVKILQPVSYFPQVLLHSVWFPVREDMVTKDPEKWTFSSATAVGNGPYKLVEYQIGNYILVEKNSNYWNTSQDTVEKIKYVILPDANTCYASFQTGETHGTMDIPAADIPQLMATDDRLHIKNGFSFNFLRLNTRTKGLDNMKVRQAINLAFDRQAYLEGTGSTMAQPAMGAVSADIKLAGKDFREAAGNHGLTVAAQVEKARKLLSEAGYPDGEGLPAFAIHCTDKQIKNAEILQEQLKVNLGIQTTIAPVDTKMFFPMMVEGKYDMGFGGWSGKYAHPMTYLDLFQSTASDNATGWANKEYDGIMNQIREERDEAKQLELSIKAEKLLIEEAPIVPISFPKTSVLMSDAVTGWYLNPSQHLYLNKIAFK